MMTSNIPGSALTPEQWRLAEQLSRSPDVMQARWINGYFAGFDAGLRHPLTQPASFVPDNAGRLTACA